jgi:hypothetical protein
MLKPLVFANSEKAVLWRREYATCCLCRRKSSSNFASNFFSSSTLRQLTIGDLIFLPSLAASFSYNERYAGLKFYPGIFSPDWELCGFWLFLRMTPRCFYLLHFLSLLKNAPHITRTLKKKPGVLAGSLALKQAEPELQKIYHKYYTEKEKEFIELLIFTKHF